MSERPIMTVVSDLLRTGLTVEQQILVNELVIVGAELQAKASYGAGYQNGHDDAEAERRARDRDRMRSARSERSEQPPSPSPPMINNSSTPLSPSPKISIKTPLDEPLFNEFWEVYPRKVGKGAARKAFRHALTRGSAAAIIEGAKRFAATKPDPQFTPHPTSWLNADRWLDEDGKVVSFRASTGPQRTYREQLAEKEKG